ncbi:hypothetical protein CHU32_10025 [Superficieibacter electus]|uniref:Uncharacterized protein n=1 Tax=Superficieibacter electus TaxID=2022662 RepID=A0A2P5GQS2_9ENTR|nr:hypothetical protein [Superficieibacter electus]POP43407.1 hypothetical protein CHU33_16140 [Superficieibacter electus]POP48922.1 hypothetical protein CHU32_10025 [Superficieibacter electus]
MNNKLLIEVDEAMSAPKFFDFLKSLNVDNALDSRDQPDFDERWMNEFNALEIIRLKNSDAVFIDLLREKAFKLSFKVINNSEISSCISDDVDLIAKSLASGNNESWALNYLWISYKNGIFPD